MIYKIAPVAKPRMTQSDKWKKRPATKKYWNFKDQVQKAGVAVNDGDTIVFHIPMPKSWSKKKKQQMAEQYHKQRPDCDNLLKALLDAIYDEDSHISNVSVIKRWAYDGYITIY